MKKSLLTLAALGCIGIFNADAAWVKLMEASQLKAGVDYVIVCESKENVMSSTSTQSLGYDAYRAPLDVTISNHTITDMPADVAKIQIEGIGTNTYALHQVNEGNSGYLLPVRTSNRTLGMSDTPSPCTIQILTAEEAAAQADDSGKSGFTQGDAVIKSTIQSDKNILGYFLNFYQFCDQNDRGLSLYYEEGATGYDFIVPTFSPAPNKTVDQINIFTLNFSNATNVDLSEDADSSWFTATCDGNAITVPNCTWRYPYTFSYKTALNTPGVYEFKFKAGMFEMTNSAGQKVLSPELVYKLTIRETNISYKLEPANNGTVELIQNFSLTFDNVTKCELSEDATVDSVKAFFNGSAITAPQLKSDRNPVTFVYRDGEGLTDPGTYTFTIEEGTFSLTFPNGAVLPSPAIAYTLKIGAPTNPLSYVTNPGDQGVVKTFENFTIEFPNAKSLAIANDASFNITKQGESEPISYNFTASVSGNTATVAVAKGVSYTVEDGVYTFAFDEGCFIINGTEKSPAISVMFTVDSEIVEGVSLMNYYMSGMPEMYQPIDLATSDFGMNEIMMYFSEALKINVGCTDPIQLKHNGTVVATIPAKNTWRDEAFAEMTEGGAFGSTAKGWLTLRFGEDERTEAGKYSVVIPKGFFMNGEELLNGSTFYYSIGIGDFEPADGSELSLAENLSGVVLNNQLIAIKLTPYYSQVEVNEDLTEFAELISVADGTTVAKFNPATLTMQRGAYLFNLRQGGNTPIENDGEYKLQFPENFFRVIIKDKTDDEPGEYSLIEVTNPIQFTIKDGKDPNSVEQTYTLETPAGAYRPFPAITIKYNNFESVNVKEGAQAGLFYGSTSKTAKYFFNITAEGNEVTFTPVTPIFETPASEYTVLLLKVDEGCYDLVASNGKTYANEAISIEGFTVAAPELPKPIISFIGENGEVSSATDLSEFTVSFEEEQNIASFNSLGYVWIQTLKNGTGTNWIRYTGSLDKATMTMTFKVNAAYAGYVNEFVPGTEYRIVLPKNLYYLMLDGQRYGSLIYNEDFTYVQEETTPIFEFTADEDCEGEIKYDEADDVYTADFKTTRNFVAVTINIPADYDTSYFMDMTAETEVNPLARKADSVWLPAEEAMDIYPLQEGNVINVPTDGKGHKYVVMFGKDGNVDANLENAVTLEATSTFPVSVEGIDAEEEAIYFDLQGIRVANPERGIYVKISNGKVSKVVR